MKKSNHFKAHPFLHGICILAFFTLLLSQTARAADTVLGEEPVIMDRVIVSVTRSETPVEKAGGNSVTVVDEKEIETSKAATAKEILETVPGITTTSNGGPGTKTSVFMRGADSKNTLIMIDGIMVNDPSSANRDANLSDINADNIERIEVIRGAMSVMYGSNATAGIINIITKKGKGKPSFTASAETGSYGTYKETAGVSGAMDRFGYSASASRTDIQGYSIANDDNNDIPHDGNTDEEDGYENTTLSGKAGVDLTDDFRVSGAVRYIDSESELDDTHSPDGYSGDNFTGWPSTPNPTGPTDKRIESERIFGKITAENSFGNGFFNSSLSYGYSNHDRQAFNNDGTENYDYDGTVDQYSWHGDLNFDTHTLTVGADYMDESMESQSSGIEDAEADTQSVWVQDQLFIGESAVVIAGVRYDDHEKFGGKATYRLAPSYTFEKYDTTVRANFGTGFRSPSLYELYSSYGNTALDPEESTGWDIGVEKGFINDKYTVGVTYFETDYEDKIEWVMTDPMTFDGEYRNLSGKTETSGVESFVKWVPSDTLSCRLDYTYTETRDPDGKRLVRRPYHKVNLHTRYRFLEKGIVNVSASWVDDRKASEYASDKNGNPVDTLDDYYLVNLAASWDFNRHVQLYARIDNLLDEYYEEAFSYATAGLSGYVGLKLTY
ncbi:MAG: TonB-dependent receptor [Desulfarculaceae bacterium]|nr:TonB-dependent receptor [Desulfarculaceae bacterium]